MYAAVAEQTHEVEFDGQVLDAGYRVHAAHYGGGVFHDDVVQHDGVEGTQGDQADVQVCVYPVLKLRYHLFCQEGLYARRLNGHQSCQNKQEQQAQQPGRYFEDAFHQSTKIVIYYYLCNRISVTSVWQTLFWE